MKLPKETRRHCPYCRKHTIHSIETAKQKARSSARTLSRYSQFRIKKRGEGTGTGNLGRYSKPAVKSWKRKSKTTRRIGINYRCRECGKAKGIKKAIRSGRIEIGEKVAK